MRFKNFVKTLPPKQRAVATYMMEGILVPEMAKKMGVAKSTVVTHKKVIFDKIGVHSVGTFLKMFEKDDSLEKAQKDIIELKKKLSKAETDARSWKGRYNKKSEPMVGVCKFCQIALDEWQ